MKRLLLCAGVAMLFAVISASSASAATTVPGQTGGERIDADGNGYPDKGVVVSGHYYSVYAYDATGAYYWDLGDGRFQGVSSIEELDQETLTTCDYVVNYRGTFENNPYLDSGVIFNHIRCHGYDDNGTYNYQIVHESDPRYRDNPDWSVWGSWEYHVLTESGVGNLVRPITNAG
jgi:hypothetical protein